MKIIAGDRGTGRTTELIKESARTGVRILCYSASETLEIIEKSKSLGLNIKEPIDLNYNRHSDINEDVLVDDINL
jgi:hypothetical protein